MGIKGRAIRILAITVALFAPTMSVMVMDAIEPEPAGALASSCWWGYADHATIGTCSSGNNGDGYATHQQCFHSNGYYGWYVTEWGAVRYINKPYASQYSLTPYCSSGVIKNRGLSVGF